MKIGICMFLTDYTMTPQALAQASEERIVFLLPSVVADTTLPVLDRIAGLAAKA